MHRHRQRIVDFAARSRVPLVGDWGPWAPNGGFLSYGPDIDAMARRAATYVDRVLRGARPADLPVDQPTRFELVINLKSARALGITVPESVLIRADRVIE
jgi:putative ABC transport system substrate-binding protein